VLKGFALALALERLAEGICRCTRKKVRKGAAQCSPRTIDGRCARACCKSRNALDIVPRAMAAKGSARQDSSPVD